MTAGSLRRTALTLVPLAAAVALAGCAAGETLTTAAATPKAKRASEQCFWGNTVRNFSFVNDRTVNIRVGANDVYRIDLLSPCPGATFVQRMVLQSRTGGTNLICSPAETEVIIPGPIVQRCQVSAIHKLSAKDVAALNPKVRP